MATVRKFEELNCWKLARTLVNYIYGLTNHSEFQRDFSLKDQIRRSALSVSSNIAEGFERGSNKEFTYFLTIARGSCGEVRSQLYIAFDQNYISKEQQAQGLEYCESCSKAIYRFIVYLKQTKIDGSRVV